jgi:molybdate transport repressor ModE-like protein
MLDVRRMKVLREVAARGSFSAAAEELNFTQSAVSQHIAALERECGAKLVERNGRGIRLTDAGSALVRHADAILARLSDAEQELAAIAGLKGGRLRLVSFPSAGAALLPHAVAVFCRRYPDVELSLAEAEPDESLPRLRSGEFDLALVYQYRSEELPDDLEAAALLSDRMHAALPRSHALASRAKLKMEDLASEPWIGGCSSGACREFLLDACNAAGFEPNIAFESDDYPTMLGLVAAGVGVTLIPDLVLASGVHPDVEFRPLGRAAPVRHISAVVPSGGYRSPAVEAMLEILREVSADFPRSLPDRSLELAS